jgi:hypothetical protein
MAANPQKTILVSTRLRRVAPTLSHVQTTALSHAMMNEIAARHPNVCESEANSIAFAAQAADNTVTTTALQTACMISVPSY